MHCWCISFFVVCYGKQIRNERILERYLLWLQKRLIPCSSQRIRSCRICRLRYSSGWRNWINSGEKRVVWKSKKENKKSWERANWSWLRWCYFVQSYNQNVERQRIKQRMCRKEYQNSKVFIRIFELEFEQRR